MVITSSMRSGILDRLKWGPSRFKDGLTPIAASIYRVVIGALLLSLAIGAARPSIANMRPGTLRMVDLAADGSGGTSPTCINGFIGCNSSIALSANGRFVAFSSRFGDLVPGDTNNVDDIFRADLRTGQIIRVSVASNGNQAIGVPTPATPLATSRRPTISSTGRYVSFTSDAINLVAGDTNLQPDIFVHDVHSGTTTRVSISSDGSEAHFPRDDACTQGGVTSSIDADGRYVAFDSCADNLGGDRSQVTYASDRSVYRHDRTTGRTKPVSIDKDGNLDNGYVPSISGNGHHVAFISSARLAGDSLAGATGGYNVYVRDVVKRRIRVVTVSSDGAEHTNWQGVSNVTLWSSDARALSFSGRRVVFATDNTDMVPNQTNALPPSGWAVYTHDLETGRTNRMDVNSFGEQSDLVTVVGSFMPSISADGRYVAFATGYMNLDPRVPCPRTSCESLSTQRITYVHDAKTGATTVVPIVPGGDLEDCSEENPSVSAHGAEVAFTSCSVRELYQGTDSINPAGWHVYARELGRDLGIGSLVQNVRLALDGAPSFSSTGIAEKQDAAFDVAEVLSDHGANLVAAAVAYRPRLGDLFVRIQLRDLPAIGGIPVVGSHGIVYGMSFSADGTRYEARVQRVASDAYNPHGGASFGLFVCDGDGGCTKAANLRGGYGTTGEEVVFSVPLETVGLKKGGRLSQAEAFAALGTFFTGTTQIIDRVEF